MSLFDLTGRVAIVTGGNGGIGLGMARGLAGAGATLVLAALAQRYSFATIPQTRLELLPTVTLRPSAPVRLTVTAR